MPPIISIYEYFQRSWLFLEGFGLMPQKNKTYKPGLSCKERSTPEQRWRSFWSSLPLKKKQLRSSCTFPGDRRRIWAEKHERLDLIYFILIEIRNRWETQTCGEHLLHTVGGCEWECNGKKKKVTRTHHTRKQLRTWPQGGKRAQLSNAVQWEYHLLTTAISCWINNV